ncbi:MAG TPA: hypothetical protein VGJ71_02010 [Candidatus Limnocylindrales bacterium]|jgi:hypothetical protein
MENQPPVVLRRYPALAFESALDAYEADLAGMAERGYFPTATTWGWDTETSYGVLLGGSSWKPGPGTLAVTFRRDPGDPG